MARNPFPFLYDYLPHLTAFGAGYVNCDTLQNGCLMKSRDPFLQYNDSRQSIASNRRMGDKGLTSTFDKH